MKIEIKLQQFDTCNGCPCLHTRGFSEFLLCEAVCGLKARNEPLLRLAIKMDGSVVRPDWCIMENEI